MVRAYFRALRRVERRARLNGPDADALLREAVRTCNRLARLIAPTSRWP
jgi:hypothetical protein